MPRAVDLSGKTFGQLTVIEPDFSKERRAWFCVCSCGNSTVVVTNKLQSGYTKSCGCLKSTWTTAKNLTHGMCGTPEYTTWCNMKIRCYDTNSLDYPNYGGRGIVVCERWLHSFENFYSDMGPKPKGLSIDRVNTNGNYEPSNCRWTTASEQMKNRRPFKFKKELEA